jgi:hypothetical protein
VAILNFLVSAGQTGTELSQSSGVHARQSSAAAAGKQAASRSETMDALCIYKKNKIGIINMIQAILAVT